jgi:GNAT superfamily N-acetyltransferase
MNNETTPVSLEKQSAVKATLGKALAGWRSVSKIGAPLGDFSPPLTAEAAESLDLSLVKEDAPSLARACDALSALIPEGMILRGMGSKLGDRQAIFDHWIGLGPEGLRSRFFMAPSHALLRKRAFDLDFENPRFAGIFDAHGVLACLAEWAHDHSDSVGEAEAAFSTNPNHRRQGLAKIAAAACALDARASGISMLRIDTLYENHAALRLAASLGAERMKFNGASARDFISSMINLSAGGADSIESRIGLGQRESALLTA